MKRNCMLSIVFTLISLMTFAQQNNELATITIKGQTVDSLTNESIPYVTMRISTAQSPPKMIKILAGNVDGRFETTITGSGSYDIILQSIGMNDKTVRFTLGDTKNVDLGKLLMTENVEQLKEVTVTAQKPLVKIEIDKLTYNMESDPESKTNNVLEMLRKVPLITVDGEDNIELKGSSNFKIYMNGKPSGMISSNPSQVLRSMPANTVKDIEVITEPGAKYDAEGIGGIINIITVSNSALQGYTASVNAGANTFGGYNAGAYFTTKIGKLGLTGNYGYNNYPNPRAESSMQRETLTPEGEIATIMQQSGQSEMVYPMQYGRLEASYEIDSLNLISIGANLFSGQMQNESEQTVNFFNQSTANDPYVQYKQFTDGQQEFGSSNVDVDYQRSTKLKDELLTISYRFNNAPNGSVNTTRIESVENYSNSTQMIDNNASTKEHTAQIDYTRPTWKGQTLDAGLKYISRNSSSLTERLIMNDTTNGEFINITAPENNFSHQQHIYSAYTSYAYKAAKFGLKADLRAEGTAESVTYEEAPNQNFNTNYFDIVPGATVSYMPKPGTQFNLGYNMRIQRPSIWYLNPYVNDVDPFNVSYGNPDLKSEKAHNLFLKFNMFQQKFSMNATLNYGFTNNSIESFTFISPETPNVTERTYSNIGRSQNTNLFLYMNWSPSSKFRIYTNTSVGYIDLKSPSINMSNSGFTARIFGGAQLTLPMDFQVNAYGGYGSPQIMLQGEGGHFYYNGLSVSKSFLEKKLNLSLGVNSPFERQMLYTSTTEDPSFRMTSNTYRVQRNVNLRVSYRFGTLKAQIKKVRRGITNDDSKAGGGGASGGESGGQGG